MTASPRPRSRSIDPEKLGGLAFVVFGDGGEPGNDVRLATKGWAAPPTGRAARADMALRTRALRCVGATSVATAADSSEASAYAHLRVEALSEGIDDGG